MRRILVNLASLALVAFLSCAAHAHLAGKVLLNHAVQCLAVKGFLPRTMPRKLTFGYLLDDKSDPGKTMIYVVNYRNSSRSGGLVFVVFLTKRDSGQVFNIQN